MQKLLLIFIVMLIGVSAKTQRILDFQKVDSLSYAHLQNKEWDELILLGKQANEQKINYYYLNYRIGIAYYSKNDFLIASLYLEKALKQNSEGLLDVYFANHLFECYIYTNQKNRAAVLTKYVDKDLAKYYPVHKTFREISLDYGTAKIGSYPNGITKRNTQAFPPEHIEYDIDKSFSVISGSLSGQIFKRMHYVVSYSSYTDGRENRIVDPFRDLTNAFDIKEKQAYISLDYALNGGWSIHPAFSYSSLTANPLKLTNPNDFLQFQVFARDTIKIKNWASSVEIQKMYRKILFTASGAYSNLLDTTQKQVGLSMMYFPKGNLNLYFKSGVYRHWEGDSAAMIFSEKIGFKITNKLWMETFVTFGNMNNYMEDNAFMIYDLADRLNSVLGAGLIFTPNRKLTFRMNYQFFMCDAKKMTFGFDNITQKQTLSISNYKFNKQIISGGLTWKL